MSRLHRIRGGCGAEKMGRRVDGIIGQDFLQRFDSVTFDYAHRRVILEKGKQTK